MAEERPFLKAEEAPFKGIAHDGSEITYILSNFDAVNGREIVALYPTSGMSKIGDYAVNKSTMLKLMDYVAVKMPNGDLLRLSTEALINNHVPDWETLAKIEMAMMEKNCSFFRDGRSWDFLDNMAQILLQKLSETLIRSSQQSSTQESQPTTNSEPSTI